MTSFRLFIISALLLSITFLPFSAVYAQEAMGSASYRIQSDSINNAGDLSTSGNYKIQDTTGETGTGLSGSANFGLHDAGYQGVQLDIVPPSQVPFLNATPLTSDRIELDWGQSTDDYAVAGYYIYRDGVRVAQTFTFPRTFVDSQLLPNHTYAYNVSAFDTSSHEGL